MHFLITGGTGFIGRNLVGDLLASGHQITVLTRNVGNAKILFSDNVRLINDLSEINNDEIIDIIINLAGEPIANKRWSKKQKEILINSRVNITKNIIELISRIKTKPKTLINASAIGFYGKRGDEEIEENCESGNEFASELCKKWEEEAKNSEDFAVRLCIVRLGIVLGKSGGKIGGALSKMLPAFKLGLGGKIASGKQFMSFIHIDDVVAIINFLVDQQNLAGVFNLTAPASVRNEQFTKKLAEILNRPAFFNMPKIVIKILFGQMGMDLLASGQKVLPKRLLQAGYVFKFNNIEDCLKDVLKD